MTVIKVGILEKFLTSRKFWLALGAFVISVLVTAGVITTDQETRDLAWWGTIGAPTLYMIIQGAIDWIKTKKVYEAQAAAATSGYQLPAIAAALDQPVSSPKGPIAAPDVGQPAQPAP